MNNLPKGETPSPPKRIAVVRPNHRLGNTLLLTPLVQALESRFPEAQIELITAGRDAAAIFQGYSRVDATLAFPTHSYRHPLRVLGVLRSLRRRSYDLAIDPIPRSRAGRFLLRVVRARDRLGFRWGVGSRDRMLTHAADPALAPPHFAHSALYMLSSAYGGKGGASGEQAQAPSATLPLQLRLSDSERLAGEQRLATALGSGEAPAPPRLGIFAHASGQKGFPLAWWQQLVGCLRREDPALQMLEFVPADRQRRLAGDVPALYTPELRLLAATLAATSLVVIADGGVMHLADAAGARVLGLFKSTDPAHYGPCRERSEALWARDASAESVAQRIRQMVYRDLPQGEPMGSGPPIGSGSGSRVPDGPSDQRYGSSVARYRST